ncbi:N-formylglutamate amidohydrolase [Nocardioides panacisoli]|uniref:N-formylglutamate amidohydrolase n=1 Tax=Nocardioides panacisoli TaxID=627624 RepID=UPI001C627018|nr:N-formylglutamate amidohydrolase [Nocardioides panacisoli]QYJ05398.1 N-formylglutamate amidohydrolase [Nocardioides panacisoli]
MSTHSPFEVIPGDPDAPVVLHVPHASTHIPADVREGILLDDDALAAELQHVTDAGTDNLAREAADLAGVRPWIFVNHLSRLVVDPERFIDDLERIRPVELDAVVYERTSDLSQLRQPTDAQREALIDDYFTPYVEALADLVDERLAVAGEVTVIDLHSYPQDPLPYEMDDGRPRPEVAVGVDDFHTPRSLRDAAIGAMRPVTPSGRVLVDTPFAGCYVPPRHRGTDAAVQAVMLEVRRDVFASYADKLARGVTDLLDAVAPR